MLYLSLFIATFVTLTITTMNTRLKQFLAAENISQAQFADIINVVRASVSHVLAGRNNPSYDFIKAIMDNYPDLNIEWLILGKGKMYKDRTATAEPVHSPAPKEDFTDDLLFPVFEEESSSETADTSPSESEIPAVLSGYQANTAAVSEINTTNSMGQTIVKQRKVSKIIVLFDDGSFQEM
jgi:transcriptional regulator with XRE-family HTH domain